MSTCISSQGEYSSHETGERFTCVRCFVFDEDAAVEALEAAERERDTQKRRADDAWETLESNWWRNHYDELAKLHEVATERTVQLAAVIEQAKAEAEDMGDDAVLAVLEAADTDAALREVRAKAIEEEAERSETHWLLDQNSNRTARERRVHPTITRAEMHRSAAAIREGRS